MYKKDIAVIVGTAVLSTKAFTLLVIIGITIMQNTLN